MVVLVLSDLSAQAGALSDPVLCIDSVRLEKASLFLYLILIYRENRKSVVLKLNISPGELVARTASNSIAIVTATLSHVPNQVEIRQSSSCIRHG